MRSLSSVVAATGAVFLSSTAVLAITQAPLGSPLFFVLVAAAAMAYGIALHRVWREPQAPRRLLLSALALAIAFRAPLLIRRVDAASDMVRYQWDGRVQRLGYNPYLVTPSDPGMEATHDDETRLMPSLRQPTPYPPGAQLFFRMVVSVHDSSRAMKLALVACDIATILLLWRFLRIAGIPEWRVLAYAWNPLVVLEIAHSGHIDALGMMWIMASACFLTARRTMAASIAFALAIAIKPLPIVLAPLFLGRVRIRDIAAAGALLGLLAVPFLSGGVLPLGGVGRVVDYVRFNGPVFRAIASIVSPRGAAFVAVGLGALAAAWFRRNRGASDPDAWAWPMAIALLCGPVIYPWYLLTFTPFLLTATTMPLLVWTLTIIPTYVVWQLAAQGARWIVPMRVLVFEYGAAAIAGGLAAIARRGVLSRASEEPADL
jgi:hypothetical protein